MILSQSYEEAVSAVKEAERKYITDRCLVALYVPLLLNHGLGFSNESSVIHVPRGIAEQKPSKHRNKYTQYKDPHRNSYE